jgi:hypothetical protein
MHRLYFSFAAGGSTYFYNADKRGLAGPFPLRPNFERSQQVRAFCIVSSCALTAFLTVVAA